MNMSPQKKPANLRSRTKAFTVVEVLTTVVVLVILAALIIVGAKPAMNRSQSIKCMSHIRQITTMALNYAAENNGWFPREAWAAGYKGGGANYAPEHYMLNYDNFLRDENGKIIEEAAPLPGSIFRCPAETSPTDSDNLPWYQSHYGFNQYLVHMDLKSHANPSIFGTNPCRRPLAAVENPSKVFLVGDAASRYCLSTQIRSIGFRHGLRKERFNVAFVDGHVESTDHAATGWSQYIEWGGTYQDPTSPRY